MLYQEVSFDRFTLQLRTPSCCKKLARRIIGIRSHRGFLKHLRCMVPSKWSKIPYLSHSSISLFMDGSGLDRYSANGYDGTPVIWLPSLVFPQALLSAAKCMYSRSQQLSGHGLELNASFIASQREGKRWGSGENNLPCQRRLGGGFPLEWELHRAYSSGAPLYRNAHTRNCSPRDCGDGEPCDWGCAR